MRAHEFVGELARELMAKPPRGYSRSYLKGFFDRHRQSLVAVVQRHFERMCRMGTLLAWELKVGFVFLEQEDPKQVAVFGRDVGTGVVQLLAVKARCLSIDPVLSREYAVHSRRVDEAGWKIHPGEIWHPTSEDAIAAFAQNHAHEARWLEGMDGPWIGVEEGTYVLNDILAQRVAEEWQDERINERYADVMEAKRRKAWDAAQGALSRAVTERLDAPSDDISLDPVIRELVDHGGLRADLIRDIAPELRGKARAIPGFLRPDGRTWLELARLHYEPEGARVVEEVPDDAWKHPEVMYETPNGYAELVNYTLDFSVVDGDSDEPADEELLDRLPGARRGHA